MKILVTGALGFIGTWLCQELTQQGVEVVGVDSLESRLPDYLLSERYKALESSHSHLKLFKGNIADTEFLQGIFERESIDFVVHLAALPGVVNSIAEPKSYFDVNVSGFFNLLDLSRSYGVKHFLFASSSSVYPDAQGQPSDSAQLNEYPRTMYAATKMANEIFAHSYSKMYPIVVTGMRFFSVYGPLGRPDMAPLLFADSILKGQPIQLNDQGDMERDFTYIEDVTQVLIKLLTPEYYETRLKSQSFKVLNIGHGAARKVSELLSLIEAQLGMKAEIHHASSNALEAHKTWSDSSLLKEEIGYQPETSLEEGVERIMRWFRGVRGV